MIAGGRVAAGQAVPMHVHQGDEVLRVLSGQILGRCQIGGAPADKEPRSSLLPAWHTVPDRDRDRARGCR
jgi:hypothetical protein